jgi:hypothetical protein
MLRNAKTIYGNRLGASDGEFGHVKDFYFDDHDWMIRYLVVDTGNWLPGRQVLIPPQAVLSMPASGGVLQVKLSRARIEKSPPIADHKPVSRQYEEEYYRYFGWPSYWLGESLPPVTPVPIEADSNPAASTGVPPRGAGDPHLRSTRAVEGYHVQGTDRLAGHVSDFRINPETWRICKLRVRVGHRLSGSETDLSTSHVLRISYMDSTVFTDCGAAEVESGIYLKPAPAGSGTLIPSTR